MTLLLLLACRPPEVTLIESPPPDLAAVSWMTGHWVSLDGTSSETWTDVGGSLVGVAFAPGKEGTWFEVLTVDDPGGSLVYTARPGGGEPVPFAATGSGPSAVVFTNPHHDFPTSITYSRDGDVLRADVRGPDGKGFVWEGRRAELLDVDTAVLAPAGDAAFRIAGADDDYKVLIFRNPAAWTVAYEIVLPGGG